MARTPIDARLISCAEADRMYRLRHGRAASAYKARQIPGKKTRKAIYISAKRAAELWGAQ